MENSEIKPPELNKENSAQTATLSYMKDWGGRIREGLDNIMNYPDKGINAFLDEISDSKASKIHETLDKIPTAALAPLSTAFGAAIFHEASRGSLAGTVLTSAITAGMLTSFFYARSYFSERQHKQDEQSNK